MRIILGGGTGFIGKALLKSLIEAGHDVVLLTRDPEKAKQRIGNTVTMSQWDGKSVGPCKEHLDGADAVINLAGEPVIGKRWSHTQKMRILNSRVDATKALTSVMGQVKKKPSVFINASAVGYYGHVENGDVPESHPKGSGFLGDLSEQWESEARVAEQWGIRVVLLRTGIVLEKDGGALYKMVPPFRFFAGGPLGSGRQWFPWVHRDDVIGIILFALENPDLKGPINTTAPNPVTMNVFCKTLGKVLGRPSWAPVPAQMLRFLLGESAEVLLTGQRAVPKKLEALGYPFRYPTLDAALTAILRR